MKELFFKDTKSDLNEQTFARFRFSDNDLTSFSGTSMLIVGNVPGTDLPFGVYNFKYDAPTFFKREFYEMLWFAIKSTLEDIDDAEFNSCYHKACDLILDSQIAPRQNKVVVSKVAICEKCQHIILACHADFITPSIEDQFTDFQKDGFTVKTETIAETWARGYADYAHCKAGTCNDFNEPKQSYLQD